MTIRKTAPLFIFCLRAILLLPLWSFAQGQKERPAFTQDLVEFAKTSAVTGREEAAAAFIQSMLPGVHLEKDRLGNLFIAIGNGEPKRLITVPLDEPGYVISEIQEDGYARIAPVGGGHQGQLYHQFIQGHEVAIQTFKGPVIGVSTVPSAHYERLRLVSESSKAPAGWQEAFIDVGAASRAEVANTNIRLLDPVTYNKKVSLINDTLIAAPAMRSKAAAIALASVLHTIQDARIKGTMVIAFTTLELLNGKGLEAIINQHGPFTEIHRFNRNLTSPQIGEQVLLTNDLVFGNQKTFVPVKPVAFFSMPSSTVDFGAQKVYEVGLPALYPDSPVELVAVSDVENLIDYWLQVVGVANKRLELPRQNIMLKSPDYPSFREESQLLAALIGRYGVSSDEEKVRDLILKELPAWAKPQVDVKGNILLTFGQGKEHIVFVAHMDETGYVVDSIREDGRLILGIRGGMLPWIWEAQAALIHLSSGSISGVFEPRADYATAGERALPGPLTVNAGFRSEKEALAAGIKPGSTTVTMPKGMIRLSENRATARGFDDRVGCAALLLSLQDLDPGELKQRVSLVWSVEEELGLKGATFAAKNFTDASVVYPIDTYVSSDDPYTEERFANCPLGQGAVIRVLESINFISRENLKKMQDLAAENNIKVQYGMTAGGTDGQPFLGYGIPAIPLSWPGRYSHSPVEVMDFRDMNSLVALIKTVLKGEAK